MRTVVILHGWGQDSGLWNNAFSGYPDIQTVVFDLPGFGSEPLPQGAGEWGIPEYAGWVREKIEKENLQQVVLLGHSFGGRIAAHLASTQPPWLVGLVLFGAPCLYRPTAMVKFKKSLVPLAHAVGLRGMYRGNPERTFAEKLGMGRIYRRVVGFDQADSLRKITLPSLIVWGEREVVVPLSIAREMQHLISRSRLEVMPKLGHNAHLENPNLFFGIVKKYVESL